MNNFLDNLENENPIFRFIDCKFSSEKNIDLIFENMEKGEYIVIVEPIWFFNVNNRFNFSVSTPKKCDIIPMESITLEHFHQIESLIWSDYFMNNQEEISETISGECLETEVSR